MSETPGQRLQRLRLQAGFASAAEAARRYGWNVATYTSHENGHRGIRLDAALTYGKAYRVDVSEILGLGMAGGTPANLVPIVGDAAVGVWHDASLSTLVGQSGAGALTIPVLQELGSEMQGAVRVIDESMNKILQRGEFAIYSPADDLGELAAHTGKIAYVERRRGDLVERSLRIIAKRKDGMRLECFSTDGRFAESILYPSKRPGETVTIVGFVVGKYAEVQPLII